MMFALSIHGNAYPQRRDWREIPWLDRMGERVRVSLLSRWKTRPNHLKWFVREVDEAQMVFARQDRESRSAALRTLRRDLRRHGFIDEVVARAFALVRLNSADVLGMSHFSTQLQGGYILLSGYVAEMATGEGKSLTATLAAATAALAGSSVHVITVNDYLAARDAKQMEPLYSALGLSTGLVLEGMSAEDKRIQYRHDIVYCTSKTVVFDYLRDRVSLRDRMRPLTLALDKMVDGEDSKLLLCGLQFAIVDEADSIFIDEAKVPLIISSAKRDATAELFFQEAIVLAKALQTPEDFLKEGDRRLSLTDAGRHKLTELSHSLPGVWRGANRREEVVLRALMALHGFTRDIHYIIRDEKVMIVDENTGRVMPDRSWERGLQQLIEVKEGVPPSPEKETLARISFQLFFRRYLRLSGMTGTCREVADEIGEVYGLGVVSVPNHRPLRRQMLSNQLFPTSDARWQAVIEAVSRRYCAGQPVLVGTRSIMASEKLSALLDSAGIPHRVLNAKQDEGEAEIVAQAGELQRVTIATNMAGRGTDIKLDTEVIEIGGLHVILTERHDNRRVDRQLAGRCARQGEPGSWEQICSLEDELVKNFFPLLGRFLRNLLTRCPESAFARAVCLKYYQFGQFLVERDHANVRKSLLRNDFRTRLSLSFTGEME